MAPHVLVFGATGQLARELADARWAEGTALTFLSRHSADLCRPPMLGPIIEESRPDIVINAAAYTGVDAAEDDEAAAMRVNADAPRAMARATAAAGIPLVHISTDYVFDGSKDAPYEEADPVNPINVYGRSKLAGEVAIRETATKHLILRTSWVYSRHGKNFLKTMLRLAASRDEVGVVADQLGCPTAAGDLAQAIADLTPRLLGPDAPLGTFHLAGASATSWHGFAEAIFAELAQSGRARPVNRAVTTDAFPTPARRPANSRLSSAAFVRRFGAELPGFEVAAPVVLRQLLALQDTEEEVR